MNAKRLEQLLWLYIILAMVLMYATLFLPYVGEEGVYTTGAMEMLYHHNYLKETLYGSFYGRPPLMSWLIIVGIKCVGVKAVLLISRFISATAMVLTAFALRWFVKTMTANTLFALLAAAIFLTGDVVIRHGWLSYADPLLSLFAFLSIASLWFAVEKRRYLFVLLACLAVIACFLTKALTAYQFIATAGLVLLIMHPNRLFLFKPFNLICYALTIAFPWVFSWLAKAPYVQTMMLSMSNTLFEPNLSSYLANILYYQPLMLIVHMLPFSVLAFYSYWRSNEHTKIGKPVAMIAITVALINFAICWFAPRWPEARYYMPMYPLFALYLAYLVVNSNGLSVKMLKCVLAAMLVIKVLACVYYYYFHSQRAYRPDYNKQANMILSIAKHGPIYVDVQSCNFAPINSLVAVIDAKQWPKAPLAYPKSVAWDNGYFLSTHQLGQMPVLHQFIFKNQHVYLYCRGSACQKAK